MGQIAVGNRMALFDEADRSLVEGYQWHLHKSTHTDYARGYRKGIGRRAQKLIYMHRLISGAKAGAGTDHINGNGLDNRRANLRPCSQSQNMANRHFRQTKSSPYKGVHFENCTGKYRAEIVKDGKRYRMGRFDTPLEAADAYLRKAKELFGEFAVRGHVGMISK